MNSDCLPVEIRNLLEKRYCYVFYNLLVSVKPKPDKWGMPEIFQIFGATYTAYILVKIQMCIIRSPLQRYYLKFTSMRFKLM